MLKTGRWSEHRRLQAKELHAFDEELLLCMRPRAALASPAHTKHPVSALGLVAQTETAGNPKGVARPRLPLNHVRHAPSQAVLEVYLRLLEIMTQNTVVHPEANVNQLHQLF